MVIFIWNCNCSFFKVGLAQKSLNILDFLFTGIIASLVKFLYQIDISKYYPFKNWQEEDNLPYDPQPPMFQTNSYADCRRKLPQTLCERSARLRRRLVQARLGLE